MKKVLNACFLVLAKLKALLIKEKTEINLHVYNENVFCESRRETESLKEADIARDSIRSAEESQTLVDIKD